MLKFWSIHTVSSFCLGVDARWKYCILLVNGHLPNTPTDSSPRHLFTDQQFNNWARNQWKLGYSSKTLFSDFCCCLFVSASTSVILANSRWKILHTVLAITKFCGYFCKSWEPASVAPFPVWHFKKLLIFQEN